MEKHKRKPPKTKEKDFWVNALTAGGIGLAVIMLCSFLMPLLLLNLPEPSSVTGILAWVSAFIGSLISGITAAKGARGKETVAALTACGVIMLPMLLLSFIYKKGFDIIGFLIVTAIIAAASILGAVIITRLSQNKSRGMKKAMKRR